MLVLFEKLICVTFLVLLSYHCLVPFITVFIFGLQSTHSFIAFLFTFMLYFSTQQKENDLGTTNFIQKKLKKNFFLLTLKNKLISLPKTKLYTDGVFHQN